MRVLMLGWEFPPFISGGLGVACYGLTKALSGLGVDIVFVLPRPATTPFSTHIGPVVPRFDAPPVGRQAAASEPHQGPDRPPMREMRMDDFDRVTFRTVDAGFSSPYLRPEDYLRQRTEGAEASQRAGPEHGAREAGACDIAGFHDLAPRSPSTSDDPVSADAQEGHAGSQMAAPLAEAPAGGLMTLSESTGAGDRPPSPSEARPASPTDRNAVGEGGGASVGDSLASADFAVQALRPQSDALTSALAEDEPSREGAATDDVSVVASVSQRPALYGEDLFAEVERYAALAAEIARGEVIDVVHAHDWMTFPAGLAVAAAKRVPLVVHVHSTEADRAGADADERVADIERRGMLGARTVIAVSYLTRGQIVHGYGIDPAKVEVVYNAVDPPDGALNGATSAIGKDEKIVLFLGRITHQKGPEYFLAAAKRVLEVMSDVKFVMAGAGDLVRQTIQRAAAMGIGDKVLFTGFLQGPDVERMFKTADLYVMPSVSEPFGIAPLEAMSRDVPVIISRQSGVSEVLSHALRVDFWDTTELANKIVAVLRHPPLANTLRQHGRFEVRRLSWTDSARKCLHVYEQCRVAPTGR